MEKPSVSRCVAVAAHGKRCQQSPFRGSPYCWHHTQSRKIPPPSRPLAPRRIGAALLAAAEVAGEADVIAAAAAPAVDGERMVALLGAQAAALMAYLEDWDDGAIRLERVGGVLTMQSTPAASRERRRAGAEGAA